MKTEEIYYQSKTGNGTIYAKLWVPETKPHAILQIAHGMAEHIGRYDDFASDFAKRGILVAGNDHAGHGKSIGEGGVEGYFAEKDGWSGVVEDIRTLTKKLREKNPQVPVVLMGHSMGSFLVRTLISRGGVDYTAMILSGTAGKNPLLRLGGIAARRELRQNGQKVPSVKLDKLGFGAYNRKIKHARTKFDWLSRDTSRVEDYMKDPLCGFLFTAEAMLDIFAGLREISAIRWAKLVPDIPILLVSGDGDPVGGYGRGVREVYTWLRDTGHNVTLKLYPGGRHEMLNETNRAEVYDDIFMFIEECVGQNQSG